jgi:hypothetical protein
MYSSGWSTPVSSQKFFNVSMTMSSVGAGGSLVAFNRIPARRDAVERARDDIRPLPLCALGACRVLCGRWPNIFGIARTRSVRRAPPHRAADGLPYETADLARP